jgi:hypothetical protein
VYLFERIFALRAFIAAAMVGDFSCGGAGENWEASKADRERRGVEAVSGAKENRVGAAIVQ